MDMPAPDARVLARRGAIIARLEGLVGPGSLISDPVATKAYECDGFAAYRCPPFAWSCRVRPRKSRRCSQPVTR